MHQAGYRVEWRSLDTDRGADADAPLLAVLELNGVCGLSAGHSDSERRHGFRQSGDHHHYRRSGPSLQPAELHGADPYRFQRPGEGCRRPARFLYGRAMARVVAHELYHVLMRTTEHARAGVARSCFSTSDLLTERFEFEGATLARLRHTAGQRAADTTCAVARRVRRTVLHRLRLALSDRGGASRAPLPE